MTPRVLVAGIGNIFFSDDGFGSEVARRLAARPQPEGVKVVDFGIRGVHLAYELLNGYDVAILIDALPTGEAAGTISVIQPTMSDLTADGATIVDAHSMAPESVLSMLGDLGGHVDKVLVVGCQPADATEGMGLSPPVAAAVDAAVEVVSDIIADELCAPTGKGQQP